MTEPQAVTIPLLAGAWADFAECAGKREMEQWWDSVPAAVRDAANGLHAGLRGRCVGLDVAGPGGRFGLELRQRAGVDGLRLMWVWHGETRVHRQWLAVVVVCDQDGRTPLIQTLFLP